MDNPTSNEMPRLLRMPVPPEWRDVLHEALEHVREMHVSMLKADRRSDPDYVGQSRGQLADTNRLLSELDTGELLLISERGRVPVMVELAAIVSPVADAIEWLSNDDPWEGFDRAATAWDVLCWIRRATA